MSIPFGKQEFAPAGFVHKRDLQRRFAKVNCEGRQLEVGSEESTRDGPGEIPAFSRRSVPERRPWLCSILAGPEYTPGDCLLT